MKGLPDIIDKDAKRLAELLDKDFEVVYPGIAGNMEESVRVGKLLRDEEVDIALMYHATYLDDAMSISFLDEIGTIFPVLFLSQGLKSFLSDPDLVAQGSLWGNNSTVQLPGTLKRLRPDKTYKQWSFF